MSIQLNSSFLIEQPIEIVIYDLTGKEVYAEKVSVKTPIRFTTDTGSLPDGSYLVSLNISGNAITEKVVVMH